MKSTSGMRPHIIVVLLKIVSLIKDWLNKDLAKVYISVILKSNWIIESMIAKLISPDKESV
jgi:hypothetical protein